MWVVQPTSPCAGAARAVMNDPVVPGHTLAMDVGAASWPTGIFGPNAKPGFSVSGQVGDNHQDGVVAVAEVLNQFRHGFTEGGVPEYAEAFSEALNDLMAKHWPEGA